MKTARVFLQKKRESMREELRRKDKAAKAIQVKF